MDQNIVFALLFLITAPLVAFTLARITHDEKNLITFYFPKLILIFILATILFFLVSVEYALITTYMTIVLVTWLYIIKGKKPKK